MTDLDSIAESNARMLAQLNELECRVAKLHDELRETASTITRLKLMAGNAKNVEEGNTAILKGLTEALARVEGLLQKP